MPKGKRIAILIVLLVLATGGFARFQASGPPEATLFCSVAMVGLLVGIVAVAVGRDHSRGRGARRRR